MGINWKNKESMDRLIGSMLAAHPSFTPNYEKMAKLFGNGATYDSIEFRFRAYRQQAKKLKNEAAENGVDVDGGRSGGGTPRTPRSGGNKICKSSGKKGPSSTAKSVKAHFEGTPTKNKNSGLGPGTSPNAAISLDDSEEEDNAGVKNELKREMDDLLYGGDNARPKMESTRMTRPRLYDIPRELSREKVDSQSNGYIVPEPAQKEAAETETDLEDHSEYDEEGYEWEDMA